MQVNDILRSKGDQVVTISPRTTVAAAAEILKRKSIGDLIVTEPDGGIIGIISERDLAHGLATADESYPRKARRGNDVARRCDLHA